MYGQLMAGGKQFVHCREVVLLSERPLYRRFYCIIIIYTRHITQRGVITNNIHDPLYTVAQVHMNLANWMQLTTHIIMKLYLS